ncbi:hypothetical protein DID76_03895 [Candidatus Marinamargulisbacteria bacterium SCGC AG-414-C22]|nr:hypothetical protein DID76_03895 [Candidatus Marinamargulisbacteria bacterium SCGC AG-414-C22]
MIESVWEHSAQKQIGKKAIQLEENNHSRLFSDQLNTSLANDKEKKFDQPPATVYGPNFVNKQLNDTDISYVLKHFQPSHSHKVLFLSNNNLTDNGLIELINTLKHDTKIQHMILSHNHLCLTEFAKAALADLLKVNHYIGWLVLNGNNIGDEGAHVLGEALSENKGIKHLVLSNNNISDSGLKAILTHLTQHPTLESIYIANNKLTEAVYKDILTFIRTNKHIKRLDLRNNQLSETPLLTEIKKVCSLKNIQLKIN